MIDLTDICDWKVDVPSFKTLQQIHLGSSDLSGDSDIEVIQVVKNQQVKLEPVTIVMKDLTVPPPPEHLIFENKDVLEQNYVDDLDISSEDIPKFLVTKSFQSWKRINVSAETKLGDALQLKVNALKNLLQNSETNEFNLHDELEVFWAGSTEELKHLSSV